MRFSSISASVLALVLSVHVANAAPSPWEDQLQKLFFGGRWWRDGESMRHSWGVGTFLVRFRDSSSLAVKLGAGLAGAYYTCQVDNGPELRKLVSTNFQEANAYGMTFSGLSSTGEHVVRCGRNNEASYGDTVVTGIELDESGELLQAVDPNANNNMIRFEAIGDSITAGYKVTVPPGAADPATIDNQNVFQTYIRFMADAWGTSDYQVIAKSGVSILDYGTTGIVMPQEWPCREYWAGWEDACPEPWDFSSWQADVVTINLGTNDFAFGNPTQEQFRQGYLSFLQQVRENYPNALIACIEPIQHSCSGESFPLLTGIVDGLEQAVNDMNDPKVIYYETGRTADPWLDCSLATQDFMNFTHPTVQGNEKFASKLLETMTEDVRRFFPEKCGGVGPTCGPGAAPIVTPPVSSPVGQQPSTPAATSPVGCTAIPQSQLADGLWATTDDSCSQCADGYEWWPCDLATPLCQGNCGFASPVLSPTLVPVPVPTPSPVPVPTSNPLAAPTAHPIPAPSLPVAPPPPPPHDESARMIAYLGNWQSCPSEAQIEQYTHIVIAFAVSYTWSPVKNLCSSTCQIGVPPTCENQYRPDLIAQWQAQGKKVILSFGGAGMGGSWSGDNNDCWEYCFGREAQVVNRLTELIVDMNLDGIDIDYEYFYEDNQNGSGFSKGAQAQRFLTDITLGLRNSLPTGSEITHAPMETDMVPGKGYFEVMQQVADSLDFLMPQYYNGYVRSYQNFQGGLTHYTVLVDQVFGGDPTKIVYGFCINDCGSFNLNGDQAKEVMEWLSAVYPCNGGAFFWVANDDVDGGWSSAVNEQLRVDASNHCSTAPSPSISPPVSAPPLPPTPPVPAPIPPVPSPVEPPVPAPVPLPTPAPFNAPTGSITCVAVPQSDLPSGSWATTTAECQKCEEGYPWWPCDVATPAALCECSGVRRRRAMLRSGNRFQ